MDIIKIRGRNIERNNKTKFFFETTNQIDDYMVKTG